MSGRKDDGGGSITEKIGESVGYGIDERVEELMPPPPPPPPAPPAPPPVGGAALAAAVARSRKGKTKNT